MNRYTFTIKHDNSSQELTVYAKNLHSAIEQIKNAEGCPENAISRIETNKKKQL
jgi:hypothetical protein